jgi:hypothetical protein
MGSVRIPLNSRKYPGLFAIVDEEDAERTQRHRWYPHVTETMMYASTRIGGKTTLLHRFILEPPDSVLVDHRDFDGLNCTRGNMRFATKSQNQSYQRIDRDSTSGYKGVSLDKRIGQWRAYISHAGKRWELGRHPTRERAALVHDCVARHLHGEFAFLNFPDVDTYPFHAADFLKGHVPASRFRGVQYNRQASAWFAAINVDGKRSHIGRFTTEEDAARAYDAKAREMHGAKARLNFPNDDRPPALGSQRIQMAASGAKGVYKHKNGRWYPRVEHQGKRYTAGGYTSLDAALVARERMLAELRECEGV